MRHVLLAVLLAALGCRPARGTDEGARAPMIEGFYRDARPPARIVVVGHGKPASSMALRMSPQYMAPGMREAAVRLFGDPVFLGGTVFGISAYLALLVAPEPIVTKATAVLTTIALVSLAGFSASELLTLAHAWIRLRDDTAQATTLAELDGAAERFGRSIGGSAVRILAVLATVYVGTKLPSPPRSGAPAGAAIRVIHVPGGGVIMTRSGAIRIDVKIHRRLNEHYSSNREVGMTVRKWLSTQKLKDQRAYGIMMLRRFGVIP